MVFINSCIFQDNDHFMILYFSQSVLSVFRALHTLERTVDRCTLYLDLDENKLVFVFHCKHGNSANPNLYRYQTFIDTSPFF